MSSLPSGTVTLLFTDIEGSSTLWDAHRSEMARALDRHNDIVRTAIEARSGVIVKDKGDGFFAVFVSASAAIEAVVDAQENLVGESWPEPIGGIRVRMGLHTGALDATEGDYHGPHVNKVARIEGLAHGGQVLLSEATYSVVRDELPDGVELIDLGTHELKGLARPERIFQLVAPGLPNEFPPLVGPAARGGHLPDYLTTFVGRENERRDVASMLTANGQRLVTLLGPGGIGKTRLAVETARYVADAMPGGAFFADLTSVERPDDVPSVLARAVGVHAEGAASPIALAAAEIAEPTLLVVDNFEHVQPASGALRELVGAAEELRVLATSRTPLRIQGESIYRIEPLGVGSDNGSPSPALELFYNRAAGYGVDIPRSGTPAEAARSIVRRIDGLPLAIELVAARTRVLGVEQLDAMLAESLDVIGAGGAERPERHRTVRATIEWSLRNVTERQRTLFRRLSGPPSGARFELLRDLAPEQPATLLDDLTALVDHSLVRVVPDLPGGTRYRQLVPLREYGVELLEASGETNLVMSRLVDHYVHRSADLKRSFEFGEEAERELRVDHANLLAAMWWSLDHGRAADLVRAFNDFWVYWFNADIGVTARRWLQEADRIVDTPYMDWFAGFYAFQAGDFPAMASRMRSAITGFAEVGDTEALERARIFAGAAADDVEEGRRLLEVASAYFASQGAGISRFLPLLFLSINSVRRGDIEDAAALRSEVLMWSQRAEYPVLIAWSHWNLALALMALGRMHEAADHGRDALHYFIDDRYQEGTASAADIFGILESHRGNHAMAATIFGASNAIYTKLEVHRWFEAQAQVDQALQRAAAHLGERTVAELLEEGATLTYTELVELASDLA